MLNVAVIPQNLGLRVSAFSAFDPGLFTRTWGGSLDPRSPILSYPPGGVPMGEKEHVRMGTFAKGGENYMILAGIKGKVRLRRVKGQQWQSG